MVSVTLIEHVQGELKVWIDHVKSLINKDRKIKLRPHFQEIQVDVFVTISTLPISPKLDFRRVAQYL